MTAVEACPLHIDVGEERFLYFAMLGYSGVVLCGNIQAYVRWYCRRRPARVVATNLSCRAPFAYVNVATRANTCRALLGFCLESWLYILD